MTTSHNNDYIYFTFPSLNKGVERLFIAGDRLGLSENKFGRLPGTRLPEQKPFRGFDITSLIRKDGAEEAGGQRASSVNRAESKSTNLGQRSPRLHQSSHVDTTLAKNQPDLSGEDRKSPTLGAGSPCSSPNISVGPPQSPPTNPYTNQQGEYRAICLFESRK